jgi:hypothetical protein
MRFKSKRTIIRLLVGLGMAGNFIVRDSIITTLVMKPQDVVQKQESRDVDNDGCGVVNDQNASSWIDLTETEIENVKEIQQCLTRTTGGWRGSKDYADINPRAFQGKLKCSIPLSFEQVRSTLSQYNVVWMHGDSLMAQTFYTLGCMMNSSIEAWDAREINRNMFKHGLGITTHEKFIYNHAWGRTLFIYLRFGQIWKLGDLHDFLQAINSLTFRDAVLTNAAAVHYHTNWGANFSEIVDHIKSMAHLTNATFFWMEPAPEEWPTANGIHGINNGIPKQIESCQCTRLTDAQVMGVESNFTCEAAKDWYIKTQSKDKDPLPNFWRTNIIRKAFETSNHTIHLVPTYWQLVSREGGAFKRDGDCTHKDLLSTVTMLFQWTRTIMGLRSN